MLIWFPSRHTRRRWLLKMWLLKIRFIFIMELDLLLTEWHSLEAGTVFHLPKANRFLLLHNNTPSTMPYNEEEKRHLILSKNFLISSGAFLVPFPSEAEFPLPRCQPWCYHGPAEQISRARGRWDWMEKREEGAEAGGGLHCWNLCPA